MTSTTITTTTSSSTTICVHDTKDDLSITAATDDASTTTSVTHNWPLHKIAEPHETNDVLLLGSSGSLLASISNNHSNDDIDNNNDRSAPLEQHDKNGAQVQADDDNDMDQQEEPMTPWRSIPNHHHSHALETNHETTTSASDGQYAYYYKGNERVFQLLQGYLTDYQQRCKLEKPLVSVQILQEWRQQTPPGRFLVTETDTHPPLWKDIGDKKARSKISKALKQLLLVVAMEEPQEPIDDNHHHHHLDSESPTCSSSTTDKEEEEEEKHADSVQVCTTGGPATCHSKSTPSSCGDGRINTSIITLGPARVLLAKEQVEEEEKKDNDNDAPCCATPPKTIMTRPSIPRFSKLASMPRQISQQLHLAEQDGRIYGRWRERDLLVQVYQQQRQRLQQKQQQPQQFRSSTNSVVSLVLVNGSMGVGKSTLARTLQNPLIEDNDDDDHDGDCCCNHTATTINKNQISPPPTPPPFFLQAKFEHCKWVEPHNSFVTLIRHFCDQLRKRNDPSLIQRYRAALKTELHDDLSLLTNMVPALYDIMMSRNSSSSSDNNNNNNKGDCNCTNGSGYCCGCNNCGSNTSDMDGSMSSSSETKSDASSVPVLDGCGGDSYCCMAMQRLKQVMGTFFATIARASPEHAVIVLLEDLHWASEPAQDFFASLVTDKSNYGVLFLATYRSDISLGGSSCTTTLRQLEANPNTQVTEIHLENLTKESVHFMLSDTLSLKEEQTQALTSLVYTLTRGNPTFLRELLRNFEDKGLLHCDELTRQWTCDIKAIPSALSDIHSVPDLFKAKIIKVPPSVQETLKLAACLSSSQVNEAVLKMIDTIGAVTSHLKYADILGLLVNRDGYFFFVSDGVKRAIYDLIPESTRPSYHLKIAQRLWLHLHDQQSPEFYAILMTQMMMGDSLIEEEEDRRTAAALYLDAGQKAAKYVGFRTSWLCLSRGIAMVASQKTWGRENYDLSLSLYNTAIEVCYCNGEFSELENLINEVLNNARTFDDTLLARSTLIYTLGSRNKQFEAIEMALETLKALGEAFPSLQPSSFRVKAEALRVKRLLKGLSDEAILRKPRMKDTKKVGAMQIMNHVILYTIYATPKLSALVAFRMVELTVKYGLSAISAPGFVVYGVMLCRLGYIDEGYRYGELALKIANLFKKDVWIGRTCAGFYGAIYSRKHSVKGALEHLRTAYRVGMRTGDIEYSMLNACLVAWNSCEILPLPVLENNLRELAGQVEFYGQTLAFVMVIPLWQSVLNLIGEASGNPKLLQGELIDDEVERAKDGTNPYFWMWTRFFQMKLAYLFGDYDLAEKYTDAATQIYTYSCGAMDYAYALFYECMLLLALAQKGKRRHRNINYVRRRLKWLKSWALHAPDNFLGKQFLVQAELAATCGNREKACSHFRSGILHSREQGFLLQEALGNEQLGKFYLEWHQPDLAYPFLVEAKRLYEAWGGLSKVVYFETKYGSFLNQQKAAHKSSARLTRHSSHDRC